MINSPLSSTTEKDLTTTYFNGDFCLAKEIESVSNMPENVISNKDITPSNIHGRTFAIEVSSLYAPTEIYERFGEKTPPHIDRYTQVCVAVATSGNSINWFVLGEMNKDGQHFRDEIYACASNAHNSVDRGCGKYYRGTNAVHVKRLHNDPFESMYSHNHYPLGGNNGKDFDSVTFPNDVTPDEFKQHMLNFANYDALMHDGHARFCDLTTAKKIVDVFTSEYEKGISIKKKVEYNEQDICELKENAAQEQPCRSPDNISLNTRGIASEKANERQPYEYSKKEYEYVLQFRAQGEIHLKNANALKDTIHSRNQTLEQLKELANRK
ncbi:hypothetical protein BZ21_1016 [Yersinia pseudotuberculosis]|uniref:hypothetical protein n=2 Tax=Yersinia pseudotuberculosis TaxID=633 RepID=UPI00017398F5|nr:hypothetical protein [Yersinia pseudotuberculosis]CQD58917.1 Uncharacterised protein [Yersinia intermedia]AJJ04689.1 hypothetical protein BZ21_1016 [Yersinia pseudotuberculosis]AJJ68568.1 hypothetical protein BZ16_1092 [Yersinia pseudotuberculosis PB1/+]AJJ72685.1 hypothetical protein BZ23_1295 [Yersinia pseudotuberculosis]AYX14629.1 hypothetical protein EGX44_05230 [Yersinia pseudotuberculosis]